MAIGGFEMELLMTKLDYLQDKLQEVEQTVKKSMESSLKEMEQRLQVKLTNHENNISEKIEMVDTKLETKIQAMEGSLMKSVQASEENTRTKLEELKNHMIPKVNHIQKASETELKKLRENKEILEMLANSTHNLTTNVETRSKTLEDHLTAPIRSCRQHTGESGTYLIRLRKNSKKFEVFCEQNKFGGGWIVIQHRYDGSVDFYRNWTEYRNGFGNVDGEFWLGLEYVHQITKNRPHELLVEFKEFFGNYGYARYDEFEIGDESELYALKKLGTYSGTGGDGMKYLKNRKFSTFDRDNDQSSDNCAEECHGAWWYGSCDTADLNGDFFGDHIISSRMMIRDIIN